MSMRCFLFVLLLGFSMLASAQGTVRVQASYTYYVPENVTLEEAKLIALDRAKLQAIADEFGTVVSQSNTTFVSNRNGESGVNLFSLGGSEVRGEWIETIGKPQYHISYEQTTLVVQVSVSGRIREIKAAQIAFTAKVLCNGTDLKYERSDFRSGDDLYLFFQSPSDGYLAVYLLDDRTQIVYCLLPYKHSKASVVAICHDIPYLFFSANHAGTAMSEEVDEYTMTCNGEVESNTIYVIFSPNQFAKANSSDMEKQLPRQLVFKDFQRWLAGCRNQDKEIGVETIRITVTDSGK